MKKTKAPFVIYNLRETYAEKGTYEFKVVLNPDVFKNGHASEVRLVDSDMKTVPAEVRKWGRKINCSFTIDDSIPDGVISIWLHLRDEGGDTVNGKAICWVIK